jgi:hypothetical protein
MFHRLVQLYEIITIDYLLCKGWHLGKQLA